MPRYSNKLHLLHGDGTNWDEMDFVKVKKKEKTAWKDTDSFII